MKESDEIRLSKNEYNDDAQAVQQSELLPIYEGMSFSGDIQPLEDISEPEEIVADFDGKRADGRGTEKKSSLKKKRITGKTVSNIKPLIASIALIVIVIGGLTGAYFGIKRADVNNSPVSTVFRTSGKATTVRLKNGTDYEIGEAQEVSVSLDGMYIWFSRNTSSATGKYDLRVIDVSSKKSLQKQGKFIEKGIDEGWKTTKDGRFVCYGVTRSNFTSCYMYSTQTERAENVADSVEEFFAPSIGNVMYFTRRSGSVYSLHRAKYGEKSENVASGIQYVRFVSDRDNFEVVYTQATGKGKEVNVYCVTGLETPVTVCKDVSEVYLDDYVYGGNLYYFTKNQSNVNWQDFIEDEDSESDKKLTRPVEGDYMVEKGFIFKRYVLDTTKYNAAVRRYEQKELRDRIREELNKIDLGLAVKEEYTCFAYSDSVSRKLASGVTLENIISFAKTGDPRIIFQKSVIGVGSNITMDSLTEVAEKSSVEKAMDYVRNAVRSSYEVSDTCCYSRFDGSNITEYEIKDFDLDKTEFLFADNGTVYGVSDGELYYSNAAESEMSKRKLIDSDISDYAVNGETVYFEKTESGDERRLFSFTPDKSKKEICGNIYSYFAVNNRFVIVLTRQSGTDDLMSVGVYDGERYASVDSNLNLNNFVYNGTSFAYVKNFKSGSGELYIYSPNGGAVKCGDAITEVLYVS